jgi:flagellar biogenesis protein FliO
MTGSFRKTGTRMAAGLFLLGSTVLNAAGETTEAARAATLPDAGASVVRVCGAFCLVVALFLAGVWLFRNWQKFAIRKNGGAKLALLEAKSLGQRQAIYVVGYQQQRLLLATSPAGVTLISHLPDADEEEPKPGSTSVGFTEVLQHVLSRKQ